MTVNAVSSSIANLTSSSSGQVDNPKSAMGKTDFLQMLITKLRYQDPINPVDDESFVADMAQFSSLEQMQNLNTTMGSQTGSMDTLNQNLLALIVMQNTTQAAGLIGKNVTLSIPVTLADGTTSNTTVSGQVSVVKFVDGQPKLVVNGVEYDLSNVTEITA
ncbi:MAG: hypothetical protein LLG37_09520 [Spirochaetia bacterium]|nr:hypothetical protein [Spirochaetia bacterium]